MARAIHSMIRVFDLDRSLAFYREAFGLELVERNRDPDHAFRSAAGSHLITFASERSLRALLLALAAFLVVADLGLGRYHRDPS